MKMLLLGALALAYALPIAGPTAASADDAPTVWICPPCGCSRHDEAFDAPGQCPECHMELVDPSRLRNVAIVLYDGVELLDFAGPGEVFAAAHQFRPFTIATTTAPVTSQGYVRVTPQYGVDDAPHVDIVIIPGGGVGTVLDDDRMMAWIKETADVADHVVSVCNGALVLAEAGLLDGLEATTHHGSLAALRGYEGVTVRDDRRWVDNGKVMTCAGVSAGIDGSLHLVSRLDGPAAAASVARYMEYDAWEGREGAAPAN
jgi:transcriptional regulator GlxA family with amidase domain